MLNKYVDIILSGLILAVFLQFYLIYKLSKRNKALETTNEDLDKENIALHKEIKSINILNAKVSLSNADKIWCLEEKMDQVHHIMANVLFVSNLIDNNGEGADRIVVIEELRQSVKYAEELSKRQVNPEDFYQGD